MSAPEGKDQKPGNPGEAGNSGNEAQPFPTAVTNQPTTDDTLLSAPASVNPDAGNTSPASGPGAVSGAGSGVGDNPTPIHQESRAGPAPRTGKRGRPKGARNKSGLPHWRLAQLRAAGQVRGKQLKADPAHQSRAGKSRARQTDMKALGAEGNARANELDPQHQTRAGRGNRGKSRGKGQGKQKKQQPPMQEPGQAGQSSQSPQDKDRNRSVADDHYQP